MKSCNDAINIVISVQELGFNNLELYTKEKYDPEFIEETKGYDESYEDALSRLSSMCLTGKNYFMEYLGDDDYTITTEKWIDLNNVYNLEKGVYYINVLGRFDCHYFIWIICGQDLWYVSTYTNVHEISVIKHNKNIYLPRFINAMNGNPVDYKYVFNVTFQVSNIEFKEMIISKSKTYY